MGACAIVALGVLAGAQPALACSCAPQVPAESMQEADAALVGRLVRVMPHGALHAIYRYEVRHVYKGASRIEASRMLDVRSARRSAACALPRRTGRSYGLFLLRARGRWVGSICGVIGPRRLRHAAQAGANSAGPSAATPLCAGGAASLAA